MTTDYPTNDSPRHSWRHLLFPPLLAAAYLPPALAINWLTRKAFILCGIPCGSQETIRTLNSMSSPRLAMALSTALLLSPVIEEIFFRWFLPKGLMRLHLKERYAEAIAAIAFAIIHSIPWAWPMLFAFALAQSRCIRRNGLAFTILTHAFFNGWQLLLVV